MGATSSVIQLKHNFVKAFSSAQDGISQVGDELNEVLFQPTSAYQIEGGEMGIQEATESIDRKKIEGANLQELPLDRALRFLEVTIEGELPSHQPGFVSETMGKVREVLTLSGLRCERIYEEGETSLVQKRVSEIQGSIGLDDRTAMAGSSRLPVESEDTQLPQNSVQTGDGTYANKYDLTALACMAGKRGDITALKARCDRGQRQWTHRISTQALQ